MVFRLSATSLNKTSGNRAETCAGRVDAALVSEVKHMPDRTEYDGQT